MVLNHQTRRGLDFFVNILTSPPLTHRQPGCTSTFSSNTLTFNPTDEFVDWLEHANLPFLEICAISKKGSMTSSSTSSSSHPVDAFVRLNVNTSVNQVVAPPTQKQQTCLCYFSGRTSLVLYCGVVGQVSWGTLGGPSSSGSTCML